MGYQVYKSHKGWALYEETWDKEAGKKKAKCIPQKHYHLLGFNKDWDIEKARERKTQLNKEAELTRKKLGSKERVDDKKLIHDVYLPETVVEKFTTHLLNLTTPNRHKTIKQHWATAKEVILKLHLKPDFLGTQSDKIFLEFEKRQYSTDYSNKLIRVMNLWGQFASDDMTLAFKPIKFTAYQKARLSLSQEDKDEVRRRSAPLSPKLLLDKKPNFIKEDLIQQWNWLFVSLWFGLRPMELDKLLSSETLPVRFDSEMKIQVLDVKQTKLKFAKKENIIKVIPIHSSEQKQALTLLELKKCKRPLVKTIKRLLGKTFDTYSGRHGFADVMINERGWSIDDVAQMMGHTKVDTLYKHYKNKRRYNLPNAG